MMMVNQLDEAILRFFSSIPRLDWLDAIMIKSTNFLPAILIVFTITMWFLRPQYRNQVIVGLMAMLLSFVLVEMLWKPMVMRPRPYLVYDWVVLIGKSSKSYAFPSGHTSVAFALAVSWTLGFRFRSYGWLLLIAFLSAFTRLYLNVHYASDVFFGMVHGSLCALASYLLYYSSVKKSQKVF